MWKCGSSHIEVSWTQFCYFWKMSICVCVRYKFCGYIGLGTNEQNLMKFYIYLNLNVQMENNTMETLSILDVLSNIKYITLGLWRFEKYICPHIFTEKFAMSSFHWKVCIYGDNLQIEWKRKYFWSPCIM